MIGNKKINKEDINNLYRTLCNINNMEQCQDFLEDICTIKEIENMAQRLKAAQLLMEGKTYSQVIEETDISSATLSRVSRCVQYGKGYSSVLKKK